ncbi:response regulator [Euzebyella marina]|uniref:Response regulator n=1 Tax=Euzebyella marina TaxID=1761453 RepID=A0A3G2LBC6_9FLAO|nr:response regulator [Euzebyella marina]AYN69493.1 response regulator [Euzebyella marina]
MQKGFENICIVDDDAISIFGLKRALRKFCPDCDPEPEVFENGLDALETFERRVEVNEELPSIIFVDLNMPVMNGWEFVEDIKRDESLKHLAPHIFIMSSSIDPADRNRAKILGLEKNYLSKPVTYETLKARFST